MVSEINMEKPKSRFIKTDDNTIYDSLTSLTWMANDSRLDKDKELSWDEAQAYLKEMNEKQFGGHSDWRLPTIHEASSLYDEQKLNKDFKGGDFSFWFLGLLDSSSVLKPLHKWGNYTFIALCPLCPLG